MPIPKKDTREIYKDDLVRQELTPDSIDIKFYEDAPFNKTLFKITPEENGLLKKLSYSFGPNDGSLNGFIIIALCRIENVNMFVTSLAQNQIIWSRLLFRGDSGEVYFPENIYLHRGEPIYVQGVTNYPAPAKVLGQMTLGVSPTFR